MIYINPIVITAIKENPQIRRKISEVLSISERAVYNYLNKYIESPIPNSNFTKYAVLEILEGYGYSKEFTIIRDQPV